MEMKEYNHLFLGGLEEGMLYIGIKNVYFVSLDRRVPEAIGMGLNSTLEVKLCNRKKGLVASYLGSSLLTVGVAT